MKQEAIQCICGNPQAVDTALDNSIICCGSCGTSHADLIIARLAQMGNRRLLFVGYEANPRIAGM